MNLNELKIKAESIIANLKDNGVFPKENDQIDFKKKLKTSKTELDQEVFLINFAKDILSFSNADGGIIFMGISEDVTNGEYQDIGLDEKDLSLLKQIDLNSITQKFEKITKVGVSIDLQLFQISTRKFYYLLIEKNNNILVPIKDFQKYKIHKGDIYYRASSKNEHANSSTSNFNRFIQKKANEKSKEFMEIWSKLLPEMVDINPREVLILNPIQNRIYGFNNKEKRLSSSEVEIDQSPNGVFNIILNAITAGEIGKITTNEGKPLYKIIGELQSIREHIILTTLEKEVRKKSKYKFTNLQLKAVIHHLEWVNDKNFKVENPPQGTVNSKFNNYLWIETTDNVSKRSKIYFSPVAINELVKIINNNSLHKKIFNKNLQKFIK